MDAAKALIVFGLLIAFLWLYGFGPNMAYLALPLVIFTQHLLNLCIGYLAAAVVPFVPDVQIILPNLLRVIFYLSGILYAVTDLPEQLQHYFSWNPVVHIVQSYRDILMHGALPNLELLGLYLGALIIAIMAIKLLMNRLDPIYPRVLLEK